MIDHIWTVPCRQAIIDRDTNLVSLLNVIEQVTIPEKPRSEGIVPVQVEVVSLWQRSDPGVPSESRARVTFRSPTGEDLAAGEFELDLSQWQRLRTRHCFRGLPVREEGQYRFSVELWQGSGAQWEEVASIPMEIVFRPSEEQ